MLNYYLIYKQLWNFRDYKLVLNILVWSLLPIVLKQLVKYLLSIPLSVEGEIIRDGKKEDIN